MHDDYPRKYFLVSPGTYTSAETIAPGGKLTILGREAGVYLQRSTSGPIATVGGTNELTLENIEIRGATGTTGNSSVIGNGIWCYSGAVVKLRKTTIRQSANSGLVGTGCVVTATESVFSQNGLWGVDIGGSTGEFDRCLVSENANGLNFDDGQFSVTNSYIVRNSSPGAKGIAIIAIYSTNTNQRIEFNTIVDNIDTSGTSSGFGINCGLPPGVAFPNNIIARNARVLPCSYENSIVTDTDVSVIRFKSPDAAPYDYHLTTGSTAIDGATSSTLDHDFDGDARPNGNGRDVGADEFVQ